MKQQDVASDLNNSQQWPRRQTTRRSRFGIRDFVALHKSSCCYPVDEYFTTLPLFSLASSLCFLPPLHPGRLLSPSLPLRSMLFLFAGIFGDSFVSVLGAVLDALRLACGVVFLFSCEQKKAAESINSRLALVMKSGKYTLGYKSTLKSLRKGTCKIVLNSFASFMSLMFCFCYPPLSQPSWSSSRTTARPCASPRLSTTPCWPRLVCTTTLATTLSWALPAVSTSACRPSRSPTLVTRISSRPCRRSKSTAALPLVHAYLRCQSVLSVSLR